MQLIKNDAVAQTWNPNQAHPIITSSVTAAEGDYYYVKVTQQDGGEAISSPISMTGEAGGGSTTVSARVATGSDDAEQRQTGGVVTIDILHKLSASNCQLHVADGCGQVEAEAKTFSPVSAPFAQHAECFDFAEDMFNHDAFPR